MNEIKRYLAGLRQCRRPTLIEILVVIAFISVVVALVLPPVKWASTGDIRFPVRVLVFDATRASPIADARVGIVRAMPLDGVESLEHNREVFSPTIFDWVRLEHHGTTGDDGCVVIEYEFGTGAGHDRPTPHAHLRWAWVVVAANGYGGVVIPVRHDSLPIGTLREQKELLVPVGLMPSN
ncbi:MAG TPA: hypothetical protein VMM76_18065 [Pirellulaceae bacterium]|nr:hypothetical protein [Pirellulaceae bacterium]